MTHEAFTLVRAEAEPIRRNRKKTPDDLVTAQEFNREAAEGLSEAWEAFRHIHADVSRKH